MKRSVVDRPGDFTDPLCREAAAKVFEEYEEKKTVTPARIMNLFQDPQEHDAIARAFNTNIDDEGDKAVREKALNETVRRVKAASLENAGKKCPGSGGAASIVREKRSLLNLHISL